MFFVYIFLRIKHLVTLVKESAETSDGKNSILFFAVIVYFWNLL